MYRALLTALVLSSSLPALAQQSETATQQSEAAPASTEAEAATPDLSPEQIVAFNQAVADFTEAQKAQQAGDNATASAKYTAALPAIRDMVKAQPDKLDNVNFLANALYANASAEFSLQKIDAGIALMEESIPHWRTIVAAKPDDAASTKLLTSILTQVANGKLAKQDKAGAAPLYAEATTLARKLVGSAPDAANRNLLLASLVGGSQASDNPAIKEEAIALSKAMLADNSVDEANKPAAQILGGAPAATPNP